MSEDQILHGMEVLNRLTNGHAEETRDRWAALHPDLAELITGFVAGTIWTRPGLDLPVRSLVTIAITGALGRTNALDLNIRMALNNGATMTQICEVLFQVAAYAGFPASWDAFVVARKVFDETSAD